MPSGYSTQVFASGGSLSSPDDIALLGGNVFVAYQNGAGAKVDDTAIATSTRGTLYVTDPGTNQVVAVCGPFAPGQTFAAVPDDSKVLAGALGSLNLRTGSVSPFGKGFKSPHGLLFVPATN
ncbi:MULTISPECIES: hypothetical protein [Streptomyces]|uniref:Uncharacterized protein n=1 Tax=Streptomyces yunnanensis TaxID=156453 RepID=A0ABY8AIK2_9ACTN|nr:MULTISPECIES: hypothetical protein [Streptomyces]WEB44476.1 hypothetical protein MOV08_37765 [Streptomyces yunnanensis]